VVLIVIAIVVVCVLKRRRTDSTETVVTQQQYQLTLVAERTSDRTSASTARTDNSPYGVIPLSGSAAAAAAGYSVLNVGGTASTASSSEYMSARYETPDAADNYAFGNVGV